jgi:hypothetical protein
MKSKLLAAATIVAALIVPAVAPGQTTVQAPTKQCSVTAFGPGFAFKPAGHIVMNYGGGTSCQGGVGSKTLTVVEQVLGQDRHTWFNISGSMLHAGPSPGNPVRASAQRPAFLGHVYRTVAMAHDVAPNGFAGCSLHHPPACTVTYNITARGKAMAP